MILHDGAPSGTSECQAGLCYRCELPSAPLSRWAWVADTHIDEDESATRYGSSPVRQWHRIAHEIAVAGPDGTVVNGDLAMSHGNPGDYRLFREIARPLLDAMPLAIGMGNHDHRGSLLAELAHREEPPPAKVVAVVEQPPYRFVQLDSQIDPSETGGEIGDAQLEWLDCELAARPQARTILFVHHPGESASVGCSDFTELEELAADHSCVQAIVTGHEHAFSSGCVDGVHRIGLPAAGFPFVRSEPCGWVDATLSEDGLELNLREADAARRIRLEWRSR